MAPVALAPTLPAPPMSTAPLKLAARSALQGALEPPPPPPLPKHTARPQEVHDLPARAAFAFDEREVLFGCEWFAMCGVLRVGG